MKTNCNIIQDLLPLYCDGVCSAESSALVETHLQTCPDCARELAQTRERYSCNHAQPDEEMAVNAASKAWKKGKRKAVLVTVLIGVIASVVMYFLTSVFMLPHTKEGMMQLVLDEQETLTQIAVDSLAEPRKHPREYENYSISVYPMSDCVFFQRMDRGFLSFYRCNGFFYSSDGMPVGYQGEDWYFEAYEDGYRWLQIDGEKWMYVEYITDNWFWFEMHF